MPNMHIDVAGRQRSALAHPTELCNGFNMK